MSLQQAYTGASIGLKSNLNDLKNLNRTHQGLKLLKSSINNSSSNVTIKKRITMNPYVESAHKRTISDAPINCNFRNVQENIDLFHNSFLAKIQGSVTPDEKINLLLEFIESILKYSYNYSAIFSTISQTIKEYQKYAKSLDSTRAEKNEFKLVKDISIDKKKFKKNMIKKNSSYIIDKYTPKVGEEPRLSFLNDPVLQKVPIRSLHRSVKTMVNIPLIDLPKYPIKEYHQEFLDKFDEFSESWREEVKKLNNH